MLLDRMIQDCKYYLGFGDRLKKFLWAHDEAEQIKLMRALYDSFPEEEKPEWTTMEDIKEFEKKMAPEKAKGGDRNLSNTARKTENKWN